MTEPVNWSSIIKAIHIHRTKRIKPSLKNESDYAIGDWISIMSSDQAAVYYSAEHSAFAKIFYETRLKHKLKNFLIPSTTRYKRFINRTNDLHRLNLPAPKILASGTIEKSGYVISEAFPGMGLGSFFAQYLPLKSKNKGIFLWRREAINTLGELVARLHNAGIAHGDLRPNNVLLNCVSRKPSFSFIDNERNTLAAPPLTESQMIKNLVQLNMIWLSDVCLTDRFRFAVCYFNNINKTIFPRAESTSYQKQIVRIVQRKTVERLSGKSKDGYRESIGFEPFVPDLKKLLSE